MANDFSANSVLLRNDYNVSALMYYVIGHIWRDDTAFRTHKFTLEELNELLPEGKQMSPRTAQRMLDAAIKTYVRFKVGKKKRNFTIFSMTEWDSGAITVTLNDKLMPYLLQLSTNFTTVRLQPLLTIGNSNARALYLFIQSQHNACRKLKVSASELGEITELPETKRSKESIGRLLTILKDLDLLDGNYDGVSLTWRRRVRVVE